MCVHAGCSCYRKNLDGGCHIDRPASKFPNPFFSPLLLLPYFTTGLLLTNPPFSLYPFPLYYIFLLHYESLFYTLLIIIIIIIRPNDIHYPPTCSSYVSLQCCVFRLELKRLLMNDESTTTFITTYSTVRTIIPLISLLWTIPHDIHFYSLIHDTLSLKPLGRK